MKLKTAYCLEIGSTSYYFFGPNGTNAFYHFTSLVHESFVISVTAQRQRSNVPFLSDSDGMK